MRIIRSAILKIALGAYDLWVIAALNVVMWRNHMWNSRRWTTAVKAGKLGPIKNPPGLPEGSSKNQ